MSEEEINKIARQIAEENYNCTGNEKGVNLMAMEYENVLKRVQKDYCIVPKEHVYMQHGVALGLIEADPARKEFYRGRSSVLERIFGKELFEQKGE